MGRKRIAVFDCETDPFDGTLNIKPFIWGFYNNKKFEYYTDTDEFAKQLGKFKGIAYAHNGGKFDIHFLLKHINKSKPIHVIGSRLVRCYIGECEVRDSYAILPVPQSAMKKDEFDYSKMKKENREKYFDEILLYLKHDCIFLYEYIRNYTQKFGYGLTLASNAMNYFIKNSRNGEKLRRESFQHFKDFRKFYFGGRCQALEFGRHERPLKYYDINSAYPFAMLEPHPYGNDYFIHKNIDISPEKMKLSFVTITCKSLGALPLRYKDGSILKLDFPFDHYDTFHCTGHELLTALETNTIKDIQDIQILTFRESISFVDYVLTFYAMKKQAKKGEPDYLFAKLKMNSLYGKFAINPDTFREYMIDEFGLKFVEFDDGEKFVPDGMINEQLQLYSRKLKNFERGYLNVCTAASITGFVRAYLWSNILKADRPIYCDTDSIICNGGLDDELGKELGQWDLEATGNRCDVIGKKLYSFRCDNGKYKIASKGVKLTNTDFDKLIKGEKVTYDFIAPIYSIKKPPCLLSRDIDPKNYQKRC